MGTDKNANPVMSGMAWRWAERVFAQGSSFIISLILARMLGPDAYGLVAIVLIFINISGVFATSGFCAALIQKKDVDDCEYSSVFYFSLAISVILYLLLFFTSPWIASFYEKEELVWLLRILGIKILISSYNSIQQAYVSKHMMFRKFFFSTSIGTLISAIVGIGLAYNGAGAWALVAQYLVNAFVDTIVLRLTVNWRPKLLFSWDRSVRLLSFGWKIMVADLIGTVYTEIRSIVIGKYYTTEDLAYYNKAEQFPKLFVNNLETSISSVLFPALSNVSDSKEKFRTLTRSAVRISSFVVFPMMAGLFVVADPLVRVLLTDRWIEAVPYLRIACFSYAVLPLNSTNIQVIKAKGAGNIYLGIEMAKKVAGIIIITASAHISVYAVALSAVFLAYVYLVINMIPNGKLMGYGICDQIKDIFPIALLSVFMGCTVYLVGKLPIPFLILKLILQISFGIAVYIFSAYALRYEELKTCFSYIKNVVKKIRHIIK